MKNTGLIFHWNICHEKETTNQSWDHFPKKVLGASEATDNGIFFWGGGRNKLGRGKNLTDIRVDKEAERSRVFSKY